MRPFACLVVSAALVTIAGCIDPQTRRGSGGLLGLSTPRARAVARRIWNQHTYHVTNVREDGTIPQVEPPNWETLSRFRTNAQIEGRRPVRPGTSGLVGVLPGAASARA